MTVDVIRLEVSGVCNARCPWCITGRGADRPGGMMSAADFERCVDRLVALGALRRETHLHLYMVGEPTLNPELGAMLEALARRHLRGSFSTNCHAPLSLSRSAVDGLLDVCYTVHGMTDETALPMAGFPANLVLANIAESMRRLRSAGWRGGAMIRYILRRANLHEAAAAADFCREHRVDFNWSPAVLADQELLASYIEGTCGDEMRGRIERDLLVEDYAELIAAMPADFVCPLRARWLVINEHCEVLTCVSLRRDHPDYALGSLFELSPEDISRAKATRAVCKACMASGAAYIGTVACAPWRAAKLHQAWRSAREAPQ